MSDTATLDVEHAHETVDEAFVAALGELTNPKASETASIETRGGGSYGYSYADLPSIMGLVRPVLARHQLALSQPVQSIDDSLAIETLVMHSSGGVITSGKLVVRMPPNPQQTGSTITYLRRYQLCALLGIAADDDDDGRAASPVTRPARRTTATRRQDTQTRPNAVETPLRRPLTDAQRRRIMALFSALGLNGEQHRTARLAYTSNAIGREITTTNDVTLEEAGVLIDALEAETSDDTSDAYAETGDYS